MILNLDQICIVKVYKKLVYTLYEYKPYRNYILWKRKAGFYYNLSLESTYHTNEFIETNNKKLYCEDKNVFYKPHIDITMSNNRTYSMFFEDVQSLDKFMEEKILIMNSIIIK